MTFIIKDRVFCISVKADKKSLAKGTIFQCFSFFNASAHDNFIILISAGIIK